jgi:hypothetical protein
MSFQAYKDQMAQDRGWQDKYLESVPLDTGLTSPQGYNIYPDPVPPYILTATLNDPSQFAPLYTNPAASLYAQGSVNRVLLSAGSPACGGCFAGVNKPDPRLRMVKPLYDPSVFLPAPGQQLPTSYNSVGMY